MLIFFFPWNFSLQLSVFFFFTTACSGIHRSLGVHVSKVRSLTWDKWDGEVAQVMVSLGNAIVNSIYESKVDTASDLCKPQPDSTQQVRDAWIQAKYVKKLFVDHRWSGDENLLQEAVIIPESGTLICLITVEN